MRTPRLRRLMLAIAVLGGGVAVGLAAMGTTLAILTASTTVPGATVTAGTFDLTVNGADSAALGAYSISPGAPQARSFTVTNTGIAPAGIGSTIAVTSAQPISEHMRATITPVASAAACTTGLAGAQDALDGYAATEITTLAAGQSAVLCLEVALDDTAPVAQAGQSANFTLTLTATQKAR